MTVTLDAELEARLRVLAEERGADPNRYAIALLSAAVSHEESGAAGEIGALSEADEVAIREGTERGLAAVAAGQFRSLEDIKADKRQRFGLPV